MRLDDGLRLSSYLTAALATACLSFAEWPYIPEMPFLIGPVALLLILAYRVEGRWQLSARAANGLGLVIAAVWAGWIFYSFPQADDRLGAVPWLVKLLPYIGPMLMVLLLVKLYRPKGVSDYWYIQGIGLIEAALGCVLAGDPVFGILFFGYLASALWFLMIFNIYREQAVVSCQLSVASKEGAADNEGSTVPQGDSSLATSNWKLATNLPWPFLGTFHAGRWLATVLAVGFLFFLLLPQRGDGDSIAVILSGRAPRQTGFSPSEIDLNRVGPIEINDKLAFEVFAENADGTPKQDLSPVQRWRGIVMDRYDLKGRWLLGYQLLFSFQPRPQLALPELGPNQFFLTFAVDTGLSQGLVLADPVVFSRAQELPYVGLTHEEKPMEGMALFQARDGTAFPAVLPKPAKLTYRQVCLPATEDGWGPALNLPPGQETGLTQRLLQQPVAGIRQWTKELLHRLVVESKLADQDIQTKVIPSSRPSPETSVLAPEKRAKVARALSNYLSHSGEYSYTLDLRREDFSIDPTEDFLRNVKEGHCERFATGLALMLRSAGVPCRLVKGFRGAETRDGTSLGDGWYIVRHSHAHAWVEAMVAGNEDQKLHWLTLDPFPWASDDEHRTFSFSLWQQISWLWLRNLWRTFVLEYNTDQQRDTAQIVWNHLGPLRRFGIHQGPYWLTGGAALFAGLIWFRRVKSRRKLSPPRVPTEFAFYSRLQTVLARRCRLTLQPGQTPQEFAATARQLLRSAASSIALADIPGQVIRLYYRARYGRLPLDAAERQAINKQIDDLAAVVRMT